MVRKSSELKEIRKLIRNICPLNAKDQSIVDNLSIDRDEQDDGWFIETKTSNNEKIIGYCAKGTKKQV
ncbi:hypothetical protein JXB12_00405 [candidate division KSB1 bacterium]|nr:hypothetical protein [candidate division KSB1 bacterium]